MKTQLDIYLSAHTAAIKSLDQPNSFAVENAAISAFNADGNDARDWDFWKQTHDNRRANMLALKAQPAVSARPVATTGAAVPAVQAIPAKPAAAPATAPVTTPKAT
jgi:hypothetical protein